MQETPTTDNEPHSHHRPLKAGLLIAGLGSLGALVAMVVTGIERVNAGHGLDTYRSFWLVELNWVAFVILVFVLGVALAGGLWFRYLEWRELQQLRAKCESKET